MNRSSRLLVAVLAFSAFVLFAIAACNRPAEQDKAPPAPSQEQAAATPNPAERTPRAGEVVKVNDATYTVLEDPTAQAPSPRLYATAEGWYESQTIGLRFRFPKHAYIHGLPSTTLSYDPVAVQIWPSPSYYSDYTIRILSFPPDSSAHGSFAKLKDERMRLYNEAYKREFNAAVTTRELTVGGYPALWVRDRNDLGEAIHLDLIRGTDRISLSLMGNLSQPLSDSAVAVFRDLLDSVTFPTP